MIRLFHVYYPIRTLVLLACEAALITTSFCIATLLVLGPDWEIALAYEGGIYKITGVVLLTLLCSYYLDLYAPLRLSSKSEIYFRIMTVVGVISIILAIAAFFFPEIKIGRNVFLFGLIILTLVLMVWRSTYDWVIAQPLFREHIYVLGTGERAQLVVDKLRSQRDLGIEVVGWSGAIGNGSLTSDDFAKALSAGCSREARVDRVIVALPERRGTMPVPELLNVRLAGIKIEEVTTVLEKISGKIEIDWLHPSTIIFGDGFQLNQSQILGRRLVSLLVAGAALLILLPLLPLIALAVKLSSPGPILFRQERVGHHGHVFPLFKFRTMQPDAESLTGAIWAQENDPRVTRVGSFLRKTHLDEIPQLWNVLKGDMGFVGPRPERPEFVQCLSEQIPFYNLRHIIRPGLTGWAQVRYQYGATVEESKQKLEYDLYYIKHMSVALDLAIIFETLRTVLLRRGAR